jgi:hypothetical protein
MAPVADIWKVYGKTTSGGSSGTGYRATRIGIVASPERRAKTWLPKPSDIEIYRDARASAASTFDVWRRDLVASLEATIDPSLTKSNDKIEAYRRLGANWDGEDALPVSAEAALRSKALLRLIAEAADVRGIQWRSPSIAPNPDGGLELSWEGGARWAMLIIQPGQSMVACITQEGSAAPERRVASIGTAMQSALWAMRGG